MCLVPGLVAVRSFVWWTGQLPVPGEWAERELSLLLRGPSGGLAETSTSSPVVSPGFAARRRTELGARRGARGTGEIGCEQTAQRLVSVLVVVLGSSQATVHNPVRGFLLTMLISVWKGSK